MTNKILNAAEAAEYLRINRVTLYELVQNGKIRCFRIGRIYRFSEAQIQEFIDGGGSSENTKMGGE